MSATLAAFGDVMIESIISQNPAKDGILPQFKTVVDLPAPDTSRWVARRKAAIVNAVRHGVLSLEEVCRRYQLSVEEFHTWQCAIEAHGVPGLRATRVQIYRNSRAAPRAQRNRQQLFHNTVAADSAAPGYSRS